MSKLTIILHKVKQSLLSKMIVIISAGYLLQGCTGEPISSSTLAAASLATVVLEDKLPTDYIAEWTTGLDCNWIRQQADGGRLCRPPHPAKIVKAPVYCTKTLGGHQCYSEAPRRENYKVY